MILPNSAPKGKNLLIIGVVALTASASFGLGMLAERDLAGQGGIAIGSAPAGTMPAGGQVVASKSSHKYYLPWCPGASKLAAGDTIWFSSDTEAQSSGYTAASGCPGQ